MIELNLDNLIFIGTTSMLKPLIFILILVTLLAIGINLGLFDETIEKTNIKSSLPTKATSTIEDDKKVKTFLKSIEIKNRQNNQDNNLSNELMELLRTAYIHFQKSEDSEAFKIYNKIIKKTQNSSDPQILKIFAEALFRKATLNNIYPNNDTESAIENYNRVINKFKNSNNVELLKLYIEARLKQSRLQSRDELLSTYRELIKKFKDDKEQRFDKEVEELRFAQSFALMNGDNPEEAIDVLDNIISKYQARGDKKLPPIVGDSILNNIELSIITNNDEEKYVDLANTYLSENKDTAPLLDMLNIMKNAQDLDQHEAIEKWMSEHKDYHFPDWDFAELSEWAEKMENPEGKQRIKEYLDIFLKQKYTRPKDSSIVYSQESSNSEVDNSNYLDSDTQNSKDEPNEPTDDDTIDNIDEESPYLYEPDPYLNDIYGTDNIYPNPYEDIGNQVYPNPYKKIPNDPNDGVSYTNEETTPY